MVGIEKEFPPPVAACLECFASATQLSPEAALWALLTEGAQSIGTFHGDRLLVQKSNAAMDWLVGSGILGEGVGVAWVQQDYRIGDIAMYSKGKE